MSDAPGLKIRKNKDGAAGYWVAAQCSRRAKGYPSPVIRLHGAPETWPAQCVAHKEQLLRWIADQAAPVVAARFDGTLGGLIDQYERHEMSPFHKVARKTKESYAWQHRVLRRTVGARVLANLSGLDFLRWAANFSKPTKVDGKTLVAKSHDLMAAVRRIMNWGVVLEIPHAFRLAGALSKMEFEGAKRRNVIVTYEQTLAIIARAHEIGQHSIAFAQALQYELNLRQITVIGEWVVDMATTSGVRNISKNTRHPKRWETGLTWSDLDDNLVLRKLISKTARKTGYVAEFDLRRRPLVLAEINRVPASERIGPMIKNEETGLPYTATVFRDWWRAIADHVGVPKEVQNRDSRAGGITEARDAGASLPLVMSEGTHTKPSTTALYMRDTLSSTNKVAELRVAHRQNVVRMKKEKDKG